MSDYYPQIPAGKLRDLVVFPRSATTAMTSGLTGAAAIERRKRNIDVIESRSRAAMTNLNEKQKLHAIAGMIGNAWAESRLDEGAVNPGENAYGLFQLTSSDFTPSPATGSPRKGSIDQRVNPIHNTDYMLWEMYRTKYGYWFRRRSKENYQADFLARVFGRDLERCGACGWPHYGLVDDEDPSSGPKVVTKASAYNPDRVTTSLDQREEYTRNLFPGLFATQSDTSQETVLAPKAPTHNWWVVAAALIGVSQIDRIDGWLRGGRS